MYVPYRQPNGWVNLDQTWHMDPVWPAECFSEIRCVNSECHSHEKRGAVGADYYKTRKHMTRSRSESERTAIGCWNCAKRHRHENGGHQEGQRQGYCHRHENGEHQERQEARRLPQAWERRYCRHELALSKGWILQLVWYKVNLSVNNTGSNEVCALIRCIMVYLCVCLNFIYIIQKTSGSSDYVNHKLCK